MSLEQNKEVIRRFIDRVWNQFELKAVDEFIDPTFEIPGGGRGPEGVRDNVRRFHTVFPGIRVGIDSLVAEGDIVVAWLTLEGTQTGPFKNHPASGQLVSWWEIAFWVVRSGKIVSGRFAADMLGLRVGIGAIPPLPDETWQ